MKSVILVVGICVLVAVAALWFWQLSDIRAERRAGVALLAMQPVHSGRFDPAMVEALPEPARRYFRFAIRAGTPLHTAAQITMTGQFSLGTREAPDYMAMTARQVLASPEGFIWNMSARRGPMRISGSDGDVGGESWTRFWLMGLIPVARIGGNADHRRSAFGRHVAEAVFWTPAALLPRPGVAWEEIDVTTARVTVSHDGMAQSVDVTVDADGRPSQVVFARWSDANPEKTFRLQPFGGHLSAFRDFGGFRLPTHVEAGNHFGTEAYFPFFIVDVTDIDFAASPNAGP